MRVRLSSVCAAAVCAAILAAGCGGQDQTGEVTSLLVTRDFGTATTADPVTVPVTKGLTAMRQLQSEHDVETTYGGRFVNAIDGLKGGGGEDWLFYVDGIDAEKSAAEVRLAGGETVQWDFHPWQAVEISGAIVGAYPAPMAERGADPLCADDVENACDAVLDALGSAGVDVESPTTESVKVEIGTWNQLAGVDGMPDLSKQPIESGMFASFAGDSNGLELADAQGELARTIGPDAGLVFAYRNGDEVTWVVTGTTKAGVVAAAELLDRDTLRGRFAVATAGGQSIPLPVTGTENK